MPRPLIRGMTIGAPANYSAATNHLAPYNLALGDAVALPKDLEQHFTGVIAQIFPLAADIKVMQRFLDKYLNYPADGETPPVYFKPAAPLVMLEVLNYTAIASNVANVGWFSQHEIAFGMPLEWYTREGDKLRFLKYALIYPYIFVDNPLSISGGRQIYGWSKAPITVEPIAGAFEPANNRTLLSVNLADPDGPALDNECHLLRIKQTQYLQPSASSFDNIVTAVPRVVAASINAAFELFQMAAPQSMSYAGSQTGLLRKVLPQFYGDLNKYLPAALQSSAASLSNANPAGSPVSIITLKQVREIEGPNQHYQGLACYQGIVESEMTIDNLTDGGSFIDPSNPDPAAGLYIDLYDGMPEASELGIKSSKVTTDDWNDVQRLTPIFPFWLKMDLSYGLADYQVWRTNKSYWTDTNSPQFRENEPSISYIDLGSGAVEEIAPPRTFPQVTLRVLPLAADADTLSQLLHDYLDNPFYEFIPDILSDGDGVVHLILSNFEQMETAYPEGGGPYSDYELTFAIPVTWKNKDTGTTGPGLIPIYTFAGSYWNTITTSEVYGRLTLKSSFVSPPFTTFLPPKIGPEGNLTLTVKTELFPRANAKQELEELPVVAIYTVYNSSTSPTAGLVNDVDLGYLQQVGLSQLRTGASFYTVGLKQIRDANDPALADYQAAVWLGRRFIESGGAFYIPELEVHLFDYENVSLITQLGLKCYREYKTVDEDGTTTVRVGVAKAVQPFFFQGNMETTSADVGWWQIGSQMARQNPNFQTE